MKRRSPTIAIQGNNLPGKHFIDNPLYAFI